MRGLEFVGQGATGLDELDFGLCDLHVISLPDGSLSVIAATGPWGGVTTWSVVEDGAPILIDQSLFQPDSGQSSATDSAIVAGGGMVTVLVGGVLGGALESLSVTATGALAEPVALSLQGDGRAITVVPTPTGVLVADPAGTGVTLYGYEPGGGATLIETLPDTGSTYAEGVVEAVTVEVGSATFLVTAGQGHDQMSAGLTAWQLEQAGDARLRNAFGVADGLGMMTPTAIETVELAGTDFVLVASAGGNSGALSVFRMTPTGALVPVEHVLDSLHTRFGAAQTLAVQEVDGIAYVAVAGGDLGVSLLMLLPDGQLVHLDSLADSVEAGLGGVRSLDMGLKDEQLHIFAASESEAGIAHLTFDASTGSPAQIAGPGGETLTGTNGAEILIGGAGDDVIEAGGGHDTIVDGAGTDTIFGGSGEDLFVLSGDGAHDVIMDFEPWNDQLDLGNWPFLFDRAAVSITAIGAGVTLRFGDEVLDLYGPDGIGLNPDAVRATIRDGATRLFSAPVQTLTGGSGSDTLNGSWGADTLIGGAGNDRLTGGLGDDVIDGQDGSWDVGVIEADSASVTVTDLGDGRIMIESDRGRDEFANVEAFEFVDRTLTLTEVLALAQRPPQPVSLFGETGDDLLEGGDAADYLSGFEGADTLHGLGGDDTLIGGPGDDSVHGGAGDDVLTGGSGDDLVFGGAGGGDRAVIGAARDAVQVTDLGDGVVEIVSDQGTDRFAEVELFTFSDVELTFDEVLALDQPPLTLFGGAGADSLSGGVEGDYLTGLGGDDTLEGGIGADTLLGGDGADTLTGGEGDDRLIGGAGDDLLVGGTGTDWAEFGIASTQIAVTDLGSGTARIVSSEGTDVLHGIEFVSFTDAELTFEQVLTLTMPTAPVSLTGTNGNDTLNGGELDDELIALGGDDVVRGHGGNDTILGGTESDIIEGGPGDDDVIGGDGDDWIDGGDGNDFLRGNNGVDTLLGGAGDDLLKGGAGDDEMYGGDGVNRMIGQGGADSIVGGTSRDVILGRRHDDRMFGNDGNDRLRGGVGDDVLNGGNGHDMLYGNGGNDLILGGDGNDSLVGNAGADWLNGGRGNDRYRLGDGSDTLVFNPDFGSDSVNDFEIGVDRLMIDTALWDDSAAALVAERASLVEYGVKIDFGADGSVLLLGLDTLVGLEDTILLL